MSRHNFSEEYKNYNYMCVEKGIEDKIFFIDRYGYIYPDCRPDKYPSICHLTDPEAVSAPRCGGIRPLRQSAV